MVPGRWSYRDCRELVKHAGVTSIGEPGNCPDFADPFAPPGRDVQCFCLHCGGEFCSADMVSEVRPALSPARLWYCPNADCDGAGFGFDVHAADGSLADDHCVDVKLLPEGWGPFLPEDSPVLREGSRP